MKTALDGVLTRVANMRPGDLMEQSDFLIVLEEIRVLRNEVNELNRRARTAKFDAKFGATPCVCKQHDHNPGE